MLPGTWWKEYKTLTKDLIRFLAAELKTLFVEGLQANGVTCRIALVGSKGDLKWVSNIPCLTRGFEHQGRVRSKLMCHQCLAGDAHLPAEDFSVNPCWEPTIHAERPWSDLELPCLIDIPFDQERPEALYRNGGFHTLRLGIYRGFTAGCIFLWMKWGYFGNDPGGLPVELEAAHGHFTPYLRTVNKSAALRSFTKIFFQYKNAKSYVWSNSKGSDTSLLCEWVGAAVRGFLNEETDPVRRQVLSVILTTAQMSPQWFEITYKHGMFLHRTCAAQLFETGQCFLNGYAYLALP